MTHEPQPPEGPEIKHTPEAQPRIWVGSLSDYNDGILHGDWLDAARDAEDIQADIQRILATSPTMAEHGDVAEEWGIFDYDNFGSLQIEQYESINYVAAVARGIAEHGLAFAAWAEVMEDEELLGGFEAAFLGHYESVEAYAGQLMEDLGYNQVLDDNLPEDVRRYVDINLAGLAQDMWLGGDIHVVHADGGGVWLFDARN
jgi:antirestriction protein